MIDHKNKFIFIHIPRTGGSSIERAILNNNQGWWKIHPPSKHITSHIAKKVYAPYWDDYFKFSFVRNPWDRMVSLLKYGKFYGVELGERGQLMPNKYFKKFEKIEYDERFFNLKQFQDFKDKSESIYMNIIGEEMDFIGKFENLQEDFNHVCDLIKIKKHKLPHVEKSPNRKHYQEYYGQNERDMIAGKYAKDIDEFKYEF